MQDIVPIVVKAVCGCVAKLLGVSACKKRNRENDLEAPEAQAFLEAGAIGETCKCLLHTSSRNHLP